MRESGVTVGAATRSRSGAELPRSILERDRDTLALSVQLDRALPGAAQPDLTLTMRQLLVLYLLVEAPRRVGELARERNVTTLSASGLWTGFVINRQGLVGGHDGDAGHAARVGRSRQIGSPSVRRS